MEHNYHLATDYIHGRDNAHPELGYPSLSLEEYGLLVRQFGQLAHAWMREPDGLEDLLDLSLE